MILQPMSQRLLTYPRASTVHGLKKRLPAKKVNIKRIKMSGIDKLTATVETRIIMLQPFQLLAQQVRPYFQPLLAGKKPVVHLYQHQKRNNSTGRSSHDYSSRILPHQDNDDKCRYKKQHPE